MAGILEVLSSDIPANQKELRPKTEMLDIFFSHEKSSDRYCFVTTIQFCDMFCPWMRMHRN